MTTKPTVLSPWYVVQRLDPNYPHYDGDTEPLTEYFKHIEETTSNPWTTDRKQALLFSSLQSAARVAQAEVAEIRVLVSEEDAHDFGR